MMGIYCNCFGQWRSGYLSLMVCNRVFLFFGLVDQVGQWPIPNISQAAPLRLCACCRRNPVLGMMPFRCSRQSLGSSRIRHERGKHMTRQERVICTAEKVLGLKKCVPSRNPLINLVKQGYHMKTCYRSRMFWWSHNVFFLLEMIE